MKVISRTGTRLVIGERGLDVQHWGYLATVLGGAALYVLLTDDKPLIIPGVALAGFFFVFGLFASIFMRKRLTHILDKERDSLLVEYPASMCTKLEITRESLSAIEAVCTEKTVFLRDSSSPGPSHRTASVGLGFYYALKGDKKVPSGIYSSVHEEIEEIVAVLREFLDFRPPEAA